MIYMNFRLKDYNTWSTLSVCGRFRVEIDEE